MHYEDPVTPPTTAVGRPATHVPVLVEAVVKALAPKPDALYVDGTFGAGGYSRALLDAAQCRVFAIDRDPDAVARGREFATAYQGRLGIVAGNFSDMERLGRARPGLPLARIAL